MALDPAYRLRFGDGNDILVFTQLAFMNLIIWNSRAQSKEEKDRES